MSRDSELWEAIKACKRAKRRKAHPRVIAMLEQRVRDEASKVTAVMAQAGHTSVQSFVDSLGHAPAPPPAPEPLKLVEGQDDDDSP